MSMTDRAALPRGKERPLMVYIERLCKREFVFQDSGIKNVYENGSWVDYYIKGWEHLFWTKKKDEDTTLQLGK